MHGTMLPTFGFPAPLGGPAVVVTVDTHLLVAALWAPVALGAGILVRAGRVARVATPEHAARRGAAPGP